MKNGKTSLYRHFDSDGVLLYVGVSISHLHRLEQHQRHSPWFGAIHTQRIEWFDTREAALAAERDAVIHEKPLHNIQHKRAAKKFEEREARRLARAEKFANSEMAANTLHVMTTTRLIEKGRVAKDELTRKVLFKPLYSIKEAADALGVSTKFVRHWVLTGTIGYVTLPNTVGHPVTYISGWQLIEHIESASCFMSVRDEDL